MTSVVYGNDLGEAKRKVCCRTAVPAGRGAYRSVSCYGSDDPTTGRHLADGAVLVIGNVQIAGAVHRQSFGPVKLPIGCQAAVSAVAILGVGESDRKSVVLVDRR